MSSANPVIQAVKSAASVLPRRNPAVRKRPSPLPLRPLKPDQFKPPQGRKQVFLPTFTLALLRPPTNQPAHFATFLTPLWMNKLDLKDYLYNLYNIETLQVRSYIIHGKVRREGRTGVLFRRPQRKKMTIEMEPGDNFIWPDVPEDLGPWDKELQEMQEKERDAAKEGRSEQGQNLQIVPRDERKTIREQARALLEGKMKWRPGWEQHRTGTEPLGAKTRPTATV